jgi:hypothetical protein
VITIEREPSWLDRLVVEFVRCLGFNYVIVAGYVAILLGRTRTTDDVDVVVDAVSGAGSRKSGKMRLQAPHP